jgi:prolyl-tRNA synthetase
MAHSDDEGLILPPRIAPLQVVIIPIYKGDEQKAMVDAMATGILQQLRILNIRVKYDDNDNNRPGWKFAEYELKGVPVRVTLGTRDVEKGIAEIARRDTKEKMNFSLGTIAADIENLLINIQQNIYDRAKNYREKYTTNADNWEDFEKILNEKTGFVSAHWDGTAESETIIKEKTKASIRCIPLNNIMEEGKCILTGKPSSQRVLFARAY